MLPKLVQINSPKTFKDALAIASSSILALKMQFLDKNAIFRPNTELEAIAGESVEAMCKVICTYVGNRNRGYILLQIFE